MNNKRSWLMASIALLGIFSLAIALFMAEPAHALAEYALRTGEACATCHVSPGGGGPRTMRGALWAARGKPDKVPALPNVLLVPGETDGAELYLIACSTCHGLQGEGLFGHALVNTGFKAGKIRAQIKNGRLESGMPSFEGKFTDPQLKALVDFVVSIGDGTAVFPPAEYPLAPPSFNCSAQSKTESCGGN